MSSPLRVLVIDDSALSRSALTRMLESEPDVVVVDRASDGEEGLRKTVMHQPDVITLDLEMPKLDGFGFLRVIMATQATPIIVVSSVSSESSVFRALELGAFDFVAKPTGLDPIEQERHRVALLEKIRAVRLRREAKRRADVLGPLWGASGPAPNLIIGVAASTGGPPAVQTLLDALQGAPSTCVLISQHMPAGFTRAFAERLDQRGTFRVREAREGDVVEAGQAFIAPGGRHLVVKGSVWGMRLSTPEALPSERTVPSGDRLFESLASHCRERAVGVVLTGMGADGALGSLALHRAGAAVWAESEETAVIFGMPKEAIATGAVTRVLPLSKIGPALLELARSRR